jgi:hypothetical protein
MDLIYFINSGGPNINLLNVKDTLKSIKEKTGIENYGIYYVVDTPSNEENILKIVNELELQNKILKFFISTNSWAYNFNIFLDEYKDKAKYFLYSHDDLEIKTDNFFTKALEKINQIDEKIGWITFTSDGYYSQLLKPMSNSVREGFCKDRFNYPQLFECHKFTSSEVFSTDKVVFPQESVVKCHAPFPHFVMIGNEALKDIGYCSDWSLYTLLIDEDWGMESLKKGYNNIWITDIIYTHPLRPYERKMQGVRFQDEVHKKFQDKWEWNFNIGNYSDEFVEHFCKKYENTNLPLTKNKFSYEWQYLRKK